VDFVAAVALTVVAPLVLLAQVVRLPMKAGRQW
jgi:hypothetical protein